MSTKTNWSAGLTARERSGALAAFAALGALVASACGGGSGGGSAGPSGPGGAGGAGPTGPQSTGVGAGAPYEACPIGTTLCGGGCVDPLTDQDHCGACDAVCEGVSGGEARCSHGHCAVQLLAGVVGGQLAADETHVYWSDEALGIRRIPKAGGAPETLFADPADSPREYVLAEGSIYGLLGEAVVRIPLSDKVPETLWTVPHPSSSYRHIAVGKTRVFVTLGPTIYAGPKTGGAPTEFATGTDTSGLLYRDDTLYFHAGAIVAVPEAGGPAVTLGKGGEGTALVAINSTHVVWHTSGNSDPAIHKVPRAGGDVQKISDEYAVALDADDDGIYLGAHAFTRLPPGGGSIHYLAAMPPREVLASGDSTYWIALGDDAGLWKLRK